MPGFGARPKTLATSVPERCLPVRPAALLAALTLPMLPARLAAQDAGSLPVAPVLAPPAAPPVGRRETPRPPMFVAPDVQPGDTIDFAADELVYEDDGTIVTATGAVIIERDGWRLAADAVTYNRSTGEVEARGNVISIDPLGNTVYGDGIVLTDSLRDGAIDNILVVLASGGRLAAKSGVRINGKTIATRAVFSPCSVVDSQGCPKTPLWRIRAGEITHDPDKHRVSYQDARLDFWGRTVAYLPSMSHPDGTSTRATGVLQPTISYNAALGVGFAVPWYRTLGVDQDLTLTPWFYTATNPALGFNWRRLFKAGPIQAEGLMTVSSYDIGLPDGSSISSGDKFRGYFAANGQLQHNINWRSTFSFRYATDDTFTRVYDITYDDTLRNTYNLERFDADSYLSIEGWAFESQRLTQNPDSIPVALPLINYLWNPEGTVLGGTVTVNANNLVLTRSDGQDMQRGVVQALWNGFRLLPGGFKASLTGQLRADVYHTLDAAAATIPIYAGRDGWEGRFIPAAAVGLEWPLAGPFWRGVQTLTPRVQFVASPTNLNKNIPNEDSRALSFDTVNLFDINRFPGYDRWEGGTRVTYGLEYSLLRPRFALSTQIGQSYRFNPELSDFPQGSGLTGNLSDIVARTVIQFGRLLEFTQAVRLDKDSLIVRTNEIDVLFGSSKSYMTVGYAKFNRDAGIEDLVDREEVRIGGRVQFGRFWSVFASSIVDLTSRFEDPTTDKDGFDPVRHRIGVEYEDECFRIGFSWRHDYTFDRDFAPGNTYLFTIAFKTFSKVPPQSPSAPVYEPAVIGR